MSLSVYGNLIFLLYLVEAQYSYIKLINLLMNAKEIRIGEAYIA